MGADLMGLLSQSFEVATKEKSLLFFVAICYLFSYSTGWYLISEQAPLAVQMKQSIGEAVLSEQPFTFVVGFIRGGQLVEAILATFLWNFVVGAFLTTTLPGVVPGLGAVAIGSVTLMRGFTVGVTYPDVLAESPAMFVLGMGTLILELGGYVFSSAAGINIAIAPLFPKRYAETSRIAAFKCAWKDAGKMFVLVAIFLFLGAVWEMTGLFLVTH